MRSILAAALALALAGPVHAAVPTPPPFPAPATHDGAHDFDFVIGDWKAHVRRLPKRLAGSTEWVEYEGTSKHYKLLGSNSNLEEFDVDGPAGHMHGQTLRLYNPETRQWSIWLLDVDKGTLPQPPVVGEFRDGVGEFYDQEPFGGRMILVRYQWFNVSPKAARMQQAFSADGGRTWEVNWICELTR
ncbi:MAG TPA: hypothetical protein VFH92_03620 [Phenylobacterium sp.]|nr:hypothetical protein [Phenylobacterium sp.]